MQGIQRINPGSYASPMGTFINLDYPSVLRLNLNYCPFLNKYVYQARREDTLLKLAHFRRHKRKALKKTPGKAISYPFHKPEENQGRTQPKKFQSCLSLITFSHTNSVVLM